MKAETKVSLSAAAVCAVLAFIPMHAIWPYQLARWGLCGASGWLAFQSDGWRRWAGGIMAVIFNPFQPIHFDKLWPWVDGTAALVFLGGWTVILREIHGILRPWPPEEDARTVAPPQRQDWFDRLSEKGRRIFILALVGVMLAAWCALFLVFPKPKAQPAVPSQPPPGVRR